MFDGRIPHGADAPTAKARYVDRKSVVVRGDEVGLDGDIFETSSHFFSSKTKTRKRKKKNTTPRGAKTTSSSTTTTKFWLS